MSIFEAGQKIIFENFYVRYEISVEDASVLNIVDKVKKTQIKGEDTHFFYFIDNDKQTVVLPNALFLSGNILTVRTPAGNFVAEVKACDNHFTFEITSPLPKTAYQLVMAHAKYDYAKSSNGVKACGIALTYPANPCFFPDCKANETKATVLCKMDNTNAKYALVAAPQSKIKGILKTACISIDKENGIYTRLGGAWGQDAPANFENTIIEENSELDYLKENMPFYKKLGVDQIDFHKAFGNFCQGDFTYVHYKNGNDFKKNVVDYLAKNGISAGLHTYSHYIDYNSGLIMSVPKWQKQIGVLGTYTLKEDIDENSLFLPTEESTSHISDNFGFFSRNTEYILIGEEIIEFKNDSKGFGVNKRGCCQTKVKKHKKGTQIFHLDGYYQGFSPVLGSELFYHIARETAKAYNEGGYSSIYLDALDGMVKHTDDRNEAIYYMAAFVCEILKHCHTEPMLEASCHSPSLWAARGRIGAWDTCKQGFKQWNSAHAKSNQTFVDRMSAPTMGWYDFYPINEANDKDITVRNITVKYQHTDDVEHMGMISLLNNFSMVYNDLKYEQYKSIPALRRNLAIYQKYDTLRKSKYFTQEYLNKIKKGKHDYHLCINSAGEYAFVEKEFLKKRFYDICDKQRSVAEFSNPFKAQTPFLRIEAQMSCSNKKGVKILNGLKLDGISAQVTEQTYEKPKDLSDKRALRVSVKSEGKKGTLAITLKCATHRGVLRYYIDTDFCGTRDFVLIETDNKERADLPFDYSGYPTYPGDYAVGRDPYHYNSLNAVTIESYGDVSGVEMSDITALGYIEETIENPAISIGDSTIVFDCSLKSCEYIEFDGKEAKIIDYEGNEKQISFEGKLKAPKDSFDARISTSSKTKNILNAKLTFGFTGNVIKNQTGPATSPEV